MNTSISNKTAWIAGTLLSQRFNPFTNEPFTYEEISLAYPAMTMKFEDFMRKIQSFSDRLEPNSALNEEDFSLGYRSFQILQSYVELKGVLLVVTLRDQADLFSRRLGITWTEGLMFLECVIRPCLEKILAPSRATG